ncbi:TPA_asm: hypothetical protein GND15_002374 [Salmonella enterica subsp. salamae serovar 58:d:z6]|uniref:Uncharacterized protein n=1 Tax=Salmonella enterica subsp. salamae serovar 58:d:z6 TaxID=41517 RepID=A0A737SQQ4_SALER|nr:hypothetical protein [Salmonella enterica subsp. salamae str. CFSAN000559]HAE2716973.1 hypothetical protein [Salmonella enterica subsp. salamae serovar 58:d:z6]HAE2990868.1 hypothetical protein [Salmonella enterica subsp. salamae serovar 58:d:z6]HAE4546286.1 hypothetical protein [Salmonella enterica subsp. salamae serovar 58:d:z6]HAE8503980.1 hypothetical protein [Salmonella enterica subsp. salamae serovar 58:d:z6]
MSFIKIVSPIGLNINTQYHNENNTSLNIELITYLCDVEMILLNIINFWDECYEWKVFVWFIGLAIN